jgi:hypothetical protein
MGKAHVVVDPSCARPAVLAVPRFSFAKSSCCFEFQDVGNQFRDWLRLVVNLGDLPPL